MSKKKHNAEHVNLERWLVSYADFITLLFAFFVVMFASSQVDRSKTKKMALAINSAFETFSIFKEQSGDSMETDAGGSGGNAKNYKAYVLKSESTKSIIMPPELLQNEEAEKAPTGDESLSKGTGVITSEEEALARAQRKLMEIFEKNKKDASVNVFRDPRGLVVSIKDAVMFEAGTDKLIPSSEETLKVIGPVLASMPNQIRVEGHTDAQNSIMSNKSNWELSALRSVFVINWLSNKYAIKPERFIAVGYGPYRPVAPNDTEQGKLKNRRVDIILLSDDMAQKEALLPNNSKTEVDAKQQTKVVPGDTDTTMPEFKLMEEGNGSSEDKIDQIRSLFKLKVEN